MADFREQGNEATKNKDYKKAIELYTKAIETDPRDEKAFSNRSTAYFALGKLKEALEDAEKCIGIASQWPKGWGRKGDALMALQRYKEAKAAYQKAVELDASNQTYKDNILLCNTKLDQAARRAPLLQTLLHSVSLTAAVFNFFTLGRIGLLLLVSVVAGATALIWELVRKAGRPRLSMEYLRAVVFQPATGFLMGTTLPLLSRSPMAVAPQALRSLLYVVKAVADGSVALPPFVPQQLREKVLQLPRQELVDMAASLEVLGGVVLIVQIFTPSRNLIALMIHWQYLRFRYVMNEDVKRAFQGIHYKISELLTNNPKIPSAVGNIYAKMAAMLHNMARVEPPQPGAAGGPKCSLM